MGMHFTLKAHMLKENKKKIMKIPLKNVTLEGDLSIPKNAVGLVIFAHGSGSSRLSPRNRMVAEELNKAGHATLLFDLLTEKEDLDYEMRFNIDLLTQRLVEVANLFSEGKAQIRIFRCQYRSGGGIESGGRARD